MPRLGRSDLLPAAIRFRSVASSERRALSAVGVAYDRGEGATSCRRSPSPPSARGRTRDSRFAVPENSANRGFLVGAQLRSRPTRDRVPSAKVKDRGSHARGQHKEGAQPERQRIELEGRLEQNIGAIALDDEGLCLFVAVAFDETFAQKHAQIVCKRRVGIIDRLILANQATKLLADMTRARLERRIAQLLVRQDRLGGRRKQQARDEENDDASHEFAPSFSSSGLIVFFQS